ncbi:P-loop containing nucleoside triphosphate hydrolase protein [Pilaira anomala]|nr:P-loop containing nucleoside triphosphate hydrolase protein [Pilaira anomala]
MISIVSSPKSKVTLTAFDSCIRLFSATSISCSKRSALKKPNVNSLTKHLRPDGLNGRERRDLLKSALKSNKPRSASNAPYVPVKRRLETIDSNLPKSAINTRNTPDLVTEKQPSNAKQLAAFLATQTFEDLNLSQETILAAKLVLNTTNNAVDPKPTEIQALAIPQLLDRRKRHVLVAAETGSGKTLAYLLPTIDMLKADEKRKGTTKRRLDHPRAIVLVPTRELVSQVVKSCKALSHVTKFRAVGLGGRTPRSQISELLANGPVDILVTTPTTLVSYTKDGTLSFADTRYLIIDEADSLFDAGWGDDCRTIIKRIQQVAEKTTVPEKITIVSATLPRSVHNALDTLFPKMVKITTPSLHKALPNLKQSFVDLQRFQGNRQLALLEVLKKNIKDDKTLVFCNTKKSVEILHKFLQTKNLEALALYKDAPMDRTEALELFSKPKVVDGEEGIVDHNVLISTDIASRGIDTTFVDHVVLYDFPTSVVDYLHRVGRTARAGQTGKATSLIGRKDRMMGDRIRRSIRDVFFIEANEHLPFENIRPTSTFNFLQDEQPTVTTENKGRVTTKINTVYTTVIVATSTSSLPVIYNVSDTRNPAQQQNTNGPTSNIKDPNKKNTVAEDLEKDKQALKRMSTILSLVGGLGVIAIVATIVIFTRMRSRHRKQREIDEEGNEGSTYELSQDVDRPNTIHSSITSTNQPGNNNDNNDNDNDIGGELNASLSSVSTCSNDIDRPLIEPSAPPALLMAEENNRHSIISKEAKLHNRRNVVSLSSQGSAPSPSAPTAKELDAMVDEHDISSSSEDTNQPHHHHHHHHHSATTSATTTTPNCSRCTPSILIAPELPPPAYTPSAPPHYALPQEPIVIESSLQSRRHSSGG